MNHITPGAPLKSGLQAEAGIDENAKLATEAWRFDYQQSIRSDICSSVQQMSDASVLINYSAASDGSSNRIVALDAAMRSDAALQHR